MKENQLTQDERKTRSFIRDMLKGYQDIDPQLLNPIMRKIMETSRDLLEETDPEDE